ncbi:alpha/beta fold hydrolase [Pendulispora rubella]|uniref:Alpha/beta fold hydrolase n=1 Tax=Pendulispora rubella TaxID=2741070 RepID=A0ABZ2L7P2_9BACT
MFDGIRRTLVVSAVLSSLWGCAAAQPQAQVAAAPSEARPSSPPAPVSAPPSDFLATRAKFPTHLTHHGPSPQQYPPWPTVPGLTVTDYPSAGRMLKGIMLNPANESLVRHGKKPVLVYLHGGFALGKEDIADTVPFLQAGFIVWAPALRGENGNPGDFEFAFGELDDARAAIDFARTLPPADPSRVVIFGHSLGGMLTSLLSLDPSLPVLDTGSAGGMYESSIFDQFPIPFEDSPMERRLRLFSMNLSDMKQPHFACAGERDPYPVQVLQAIMPQAKAEHLPLEAKVVPGDHHSSLEGCMNAYLARVTAKMR